MNPPTSFLFTSGELRGEATARVARVVANKVRNAVIERVEE